MLQFILCGVKTEYSFFCIKKIADDNYPSWNKFTINN
jgi:hypothetical protein